MVVLAMIALHAGQDLPGADKGTEERRDGGCASIPGGGRVQARPVPGLRAPVFSGDCLQFGGCKSGRTWAELEQNKKHSISKEMMHTSPLRWIYFIF